MTSGIQPPFSGAPQPVQGVTGGPPVLGGQISNDPTTGNVVVAPNPGQVLQVRKGSNPTSLQVYEYFHTNTDYSRVSLNSQTGGPFQLAIETAPPSIVRGLDISANGQITINGNPIIVTHQVLASTSGPSTASGTPVQLPDMTLTFTLVETKSLYVSFFSGFLNTVTNALAVINIFLDGSSSGFANTISQPPAANGLVSHSIMGILPNIPSGSHTVAIFWSTNAGTLTAYSTQRALSVMEMP